MPKSFILMAAIPPTLGHVDLINFAKNLTGDAHVILVTRGSEPFQKERFDALTKHYCHEPKVKIQEFHVPGLDAEGNAFWGDVLRDLGFRKGDYLVASESWGSEIAEMLDGEFYPYDLDREIRYTKATAIREDIDANWDWIIPEFQRKLQKRIVLFGAESTGKSTLTKRLREEFPHSVSAFEYARPLLELNPELTVDSMTGIWRGQKALQETIADMTPVPRVVFLDTDLFSTLGYWEFWEPGTVPAALRTDAIAMKADFYIQTNSDIPFEADPIRYGGNKREQTDAYWNSVLNKYEIPHVMLKTISIEDRVAESMDSLKAIIPKGIHHERRDLDQ